MMKPSTVLAAGACLVFWACNSTRRVGLDGDLVAEDAARQGADAAAATNGHVRGGGERCDDCKILVGLLVSRSGALAGTHHGIIRGAQLACDEINAAGGVVGMKVGLRVEDDGTAAAT